MCVYCAMGDYAWKWHPPAPVYPMPPQRYPFPEPLRAPRHYDLKELEALRDLLREIKQLEDSIGCPCPSERGKPDYLGELEARISVARGVEKPSSFVGGTD